MEKDRVAGAMTARPGIKLWLALMLAWTAGFVDVSGYLTLLDTFTSHLSGNNVAMMADIARHEWSNVIRRAIPIPTFILGVFLAAVFGIIAGRKGLRRRLSIAIGFEAVLLVAFVFYMRRILHSGVKVAEWHYWLGSVFLAVAMGVQSASMRQVWGKPVHTAFITGMLTSLTESFAELLLTKGKDAQARLIVLVNSGIWLAFVSGAACGGFSELRWGVVAIAAPIGLLVVVVTCDLIWPVHHNQ